MILQKIVSQRLLAIAQEKNLLPESTLQRQALTVVKRPKDFLSVLQRDNVALIAEIKRRSPSAGQICSDMSPDLTARLYAENGAAAISVLIEPDFFHGSPADLLAARQALADHENIAFLYKDFVVTTYQIYLASVTGADAILLIAACLGDSELRSLYDCAIGLGLTPLIEVHNRTELERAMRLEPSLIGINNRDLHTFYTDINTTISLAPLIGNETLIVSESGIHNVDDVRKLAAIGVRAILVGEAILKAKDRAAQVSTLASVSR